MLSLDPNIGFHGIQILLEHGLAARFPDIMKRFHDRLRRITEEEQVDRSRVAAQNVALVEEKLRKAESLLRRLFLDEILRTYPYVPPRSYCFPH